MAQRFRFPRTTTLVVLSTIIVAGVSAAVTRSTDSTQPSTLVRGNAPGEWRYWGGDAWSTRYSPLDQINAANFESLEQAWRWPAGAFGADEYYRTTPLYANGRLFTVASTRRVATAIDPATVEAAVSRAGLAEGATAVCRTWTLILDRRRQRTCDHHHARLPHGAARRAHRHPRSGVR